MARAVSENGGNHAGLYGWLLDREEAALQAPGRTLAWTPGQPSHTGTPERLAALQAGEPVNIDAGALPPSARPTGRTHWWHRAIVHVDGAVEFVRDTGQWATENGV